MAMNLIEWVPSWFELEVPEMEKQVISWCKKNKQKDRLVIFSKSDLKTFLRKNGLRKHTDGKHNFFSTAKTVVSWNELEEEWGLLYDIKNAEDFSEILYRVPKSPEKASGIVYLKKEKN